ncbi:atp-4 [Pristionchus pacificus]|nr:atp-4 [Pristionchus pacificus]|eukprot:PDM76652.1 atp-4 [Pristionchus pacificus]
MIDHCFRVVNMFRVAASRALSTSARRDGDLVQQAFVKKIKEFGQKGGDLVNTNPEVKKALQDELNRLAQKFHLANADIVGRIPTNFESAKVVESSVAALLEGQSVSALSETIKKEKSEYVATRAAKKAAEVARAAAIKGN